MGSIRRVSRDCHGRSAKVNGTVRGSFLALRERDIHRRHKGMFTVIILSSKRSNKHTGQLVVFFLFLNFFPSFHFAWLCYKRKSITHRPAFISRDNTVRLFKRFGRRRRCSSREERDGVRFSREEVQNVLRYWYSRKQP